MIDASILKISGDTVIRLLLRKYEVLPGPEVGDVIGVDDFAYKKRHTYGTIIVNEENHEPIALLDGRNGDTLRDWLNVLSLYHNNSCSRKSRLSR